MPVTRIPEEPPLHSTASASSFNAYNPTLLTELLLEIAADFPLDYPIKERLRKRLSLTRSSVMKDLLLYIIETKGKRIRPILIALSCSLFEYNPEDVADVATAAELIHLASIVHDDIIDETDKRRGKPTVSALWSNSASVLLGDFLFASSFDILTKYNDTRILHLMTEAIKEMCEGEIEEVSFSFNLELTEEAYLDRIMKKTASLLGTCCKAGALIGGASEREADLLYDYGINIGYAYQITDDILDFIGDPAITGKPCGTDLVQGVITLPVIKMIEDNEEAPIIKEIITKEIKEKRALPLDSFKYIQRQLIDSGAVDYSFMKAREYAEKAKENIAFIKAASVKGDGRARDYLLRLADSIISRRA